MTRDEAGQAVEPGPQAKFREKLEAGRFEIQRCGGCQRHVFYPRVLCPACGDARLAWVTPSGTGEVYSTTVIRRKPEDGGDYNVALIDLDEGVRMMGRVDGVAPDQVRIGMRVRARVEREDGTALVVWSPEGGAR